MFYQEIKGLIIFLLARKRKGGYNNPLVENRKLF